jgi:putative ABC transport system substrate-binding protein
VILLGLLEGTTMTRRLIGLLVTLALGLLVAPLASDAQQPKEVPRIGVLAVERPPPAGEIDAFQQGLRELGYVEGQHLTIEWRFTEGRDERARDLATELVQLGVAVIVASGNAPVLAAQQATRTIPIVFTRISDPVARGLVASIARPGGNLTGLGEFSGVDMNAKRLELLLQAVPGVTRVAVLRYKSPAFAELPRSSVEVLQEAARAVGVALQLLPVHHPDDLEGAFAAMTRERAQALLLVPSSLFTAHPTRLLRLVAESRLPAIFYRRLFAEAGALMAYGPNIRDEFRHAAAYVDKILKGAKPADLPVEQPTTFELVINLKTAQALGLTIPPTLLFQADEVIR